MQNLIRAVVKPGMGEHGNVFWRPQFPLPAGETFAGPGSEAAVGVRKSAGVILPRLLSTLLGHCLVCYCSAGLGGGA